jgi:hypothetical protein
MDLAWVVRWRIRFEEAGFLFDSFVFFGPEDLVSAASMGVMALVFLLDGQASGGFVIEDTFVLFVFRVITGSC